MMESTRTHNITHVQTLCVCGGWGVGGLAESRGGLCSRMSFHCGKMSLAYKGDFQWDFCLISLS